MGGYCGDGEPVALRAEATDETQIEGLICDDCKCAIPKGEKVFVTCYASPPTPAAPPDRWLPSRKISSGSPSVNEWENTVDCAKCSEVLQYFWDADAECLHPGGLKEYIGELAPHDFQQGGDFEDVPQLAHLSQWIMKVV